MIEKETPTILNLVPRILTQTLVVNTDELRSANNTVSIFHLFYVSSQCYLKGLFSTLFNVLSFGEKKLVCPGWYVCKLGSHTHILVCWAIARKLISSVTVFASPFIS